MIFVDTNVLLYATGSPHPLREPSLRLLAAIEEGRVQATTTHLVIQELAYVKARRLSRPDAAAIARDFAIALAPLLIVDDNVLARGLDLFARYALDAFDAVLAAAAITQNADALVSADAAFAEVPRLRHVAPGTPEFDALIA